MPKFGYSIAILIIEQNSSPNMEKKCSQVAFYGEFLYSARSNNNTIELYNRKLIDAKQQKRQSIRKLPKLLLSLIKSRTLVFVFAIVSLGTFLISSEGSSPDIATAVKLLAAVYLMALATYLYNDLTDYNVDKANERKQRFESSNKQLFFFVVCLFVVSMLVAFSINWQTGAASVVFFVLGILYSHPKSHMKDMFVIKTLVTAGGAFIASQMGMLATDNYTVPALVSSVIVFVFWFILGPLGDIADIRGDKLAGRRTIPIVIGVGNTILLMACAIFSIALIIIFYQYLAQNMHVLGSASGVAVCAYAIFKIVQVSKKYNDKASIKQSRTHLRYSIFSIQFSIFLGLVLGQNQIYSPF